MDTQDLCGYLSPKIANVLHYSQQFAFHDSSLFKNNLHVMHKCHHPLLVEPPQDLVAAYDLTSVHSALADREPATQIEWAEHVNTSREYWNTEYAICTRVCPMAGCRK